jgi:predicted nuclease of predicted toxin-antitoxin system
MLALAADENFNNDIVRGLRRRAPDLDIIRVQDVGLSGADDPAVLEWAAHEGRVLLTHDVSTITRFAYDRVRAGKSMSDVFEVSRNARSGLLLRISC